VRRAGGGRVAEGVVASAGPADDEGGGLMFGAHDIVTGDVLETLRQLPDNSVDGLLCDPPYGFRFMGKKWDYDVPSVDVWREALRVLKPGAALLSFGGARTFHRIATAIEDAGFELRDCLMWMYGKGFPKSLNVGLALDKAVGAVRPVVGERTLTGNAAISTKEKGGTYGVQVGSIPPKVVNVTAAASPLAQQWDGYGTALKPGWEPIILARKPLEGTVAENVTKWGVGALAIDSCRIGGEKMPKTRSGGQLVSQNTAMTGGNYNRIDAGEADGRWPPNVALDEEAAELLDATVGRRKSTLTGRADPSVSHPHNGTKASSPHLVYGEGLQTPKSRVYADDGGPSRFFYCAKVSTKEREYGCEELPKRSAGEVTDREEDSAGLAPPRSGAGRTGGARNHHPTLKPLALTRWLASLIKPPTTDAVLLIPYCGAGSEIIGALQAGWPMVFGIEGEADYAQIAEARIAAWARDGEREAA
jgi:site-specific DNA-methyltransferase (adenine-specific)